MPRIAYKSFYGEHAYESKVVPITLGENFNPGIHVTYSTGFMHYSMSLPTSQFVKN